MALDNKFRVSELAQSGSRAIISEDPISKTHTFIDGSTTIVSQSASEPYEHIEGDRDGELTNFIEKPKYKEEQLKKAVDTVIDELILPPLPPSPPVVPKPIYDDLLVRYNAAVALLAERDNEIRSLRAKITQLEGQIQSLKQQLDAALVARAIAENQLQQQASSFGDLAAKFSQAIIKATREASARVSLQAQVAGLDAQKETLREQILGLRQIVASLQGQVEAQLAILDQQVATSQAAQQQAQDQISGNQATNTAVASGFEDMGDGDVYVKWSTGELSTGNQVVGFTTKCKDYSNGPGKWKGGDKLEIQNLKDDDGVSVNRVDIKVTSQGGGGWRGSKNWFKPSSQPNIGRGKKGSVAMVVEPWIHGQNGGSNQVEPSDDLHEWSWGFPSREAKTHTGNFELTIGCSDGSTVKKTFKWRLEKNKVSV
jgi:hypothetical protein